MFHLGNVERFDPLVNGFLPIFTKGFVFWGFFVVAVVGFFGFFGWLVGWLVFSVRTRA